MDAKNNSIPQHIGLILDGNRRWAKENGLPQLEGHRVGYENIKTIADYAFGQGVQYVSAYIFSTENWNRSKQEVDYLMNLLPIVFKKYLKDFIKNEIRIHWLGTYDNLGEKEINLINNAVEKTKKFTKSNLCFCFNYGGWKEITDATQKILNENIDPDKVTPELFRNYLYSPEVPDVDIVVRTSGEKRISNFMLWRLAYSEMYFMDKKWPAFSTSDMDDVINEYKNRQRRFGC